MAQEPITDSSIGFVSPELTRGMTFADVGSTGLRQFSGWVREEFLQDLVGREGMAKYREMSDNNPTIGAILFSIMQAIRKVEWRLEAPNDSAEAKREVEFVEQCMEDMTHTWENFVEEALSMLVYGFAPHEIVYKRRLGRRPESRPGPKPTRDIASSNFDDGRIGWRRLPLRGQDTIFKWFFDDNGQIEGMSQQPWVGAIIDLPIEKLLLFRPISHKNNPEGRSVLRNSYTPYYYSKRLQEQEAIMVERFNGFPVLYVPSTLIDQASATGGQGQPLNTAAFQALQQYKKIVTNIRIDEQMGAVLPSDTYIDPTTGKPSTVRMYEFQLVTPSSGGRGNVHPNDMIARYKIDMMTTVLADFIQMGHEVRGTNNLASTKVDMFYAAVQGWSKSMAAVINRYGLERLWRINNLNPDLMPHFEPDLPQRIDLDGLGSFVANMATAGMPLFPDEELQAFLRESAGLPEDTEGTAQPQAINNAQAIAENQPKMKDTDSVKKHILGKVMREIAKRRGLTP